MLEIRHLTKIYDAKGAAVRALDDVSIRFPETGMVFLLGKSGSGKSTLLNLCGGLDSPDAGEVIIKGRSSKDFSPSDFDDYRNTFIGFVFQEYNILNEFTVEENIALALELQGKSKNRRQVQDILAQVGLEKCAGCKPNTLSDGLKQRIAIARALVKNPEIIMADEPTGGLDSNTSRQVLDTLKKLSAGKLVIVVSHDRESAEIYGDRIIELKDGKVISDVTKERVTATPMSDNLAFIGEDTISVQDGSRLTEADMGRIRAFLTGGRGRVLLSSGQNDIEHFRKAALIDENGARETFADTDEAALPAKTYTAADSLFIRSKLPFGRAARIGASSLHVRPLRLFFTIFLSFIAFTMFGVFSTLTFYNEKHVLLESYLDSEYDTVILEKYYRYDRIEYDRASGKEIDRYSTDGGALFTPADLNAYADAYGGALGLFNFSENCYDAFSISNLNDNSGHPYYTDSFNYFAVNGDRYGKIEWLTPRVDLSALGEDEIVISSYLFDSIAYGGLQGYVENEYGNFYSTGETVPLETYGDIVGEKLLLQNTLFTVAGVFHCDPPERFDALKDSSQDYDYQLQYEMQDEINQGLYRVALVGDGFYRANKEIFSFSYAVPFDHNNTLNGELRLSYPTDAGESNSYLNFIIAYTEQSAAETRSIYRFDQSKTSLEPGEILLSAGDYFWVLNQVFGEIESEGFRQIQEETYERTRAEYCAENWDAYLLQYRENHSADYEDLYQNFLSQNYSEDEARQRAEEIIESDARGSFALDADATAAKAANAAADAWKQQFLESSNILLNAYKYSDTEVADALAFLSPYFDAAYRDGKFITEVKLEDETGNDIGTYTVVGFYVSDSIPVLFSQADADALLQTYGLPTLERIESAYTQPADAKYNYILVATPKRAALTDLIDETDTLAADDTFYRIASPLANTVRDISSTIGVLEQVFLWLGVALALFSMLLLFNFISVSITNKKKEIGILRAVGARGADLFKIFYSESVIVAAICFVLSVAASFILCGVINDLVAAELQATLFVFGPISVLSLVGIAAVTSFIATFLPVYSIAKKKPADSIRAL